MGILQLPSVLPGQVGVIGAIKYMTTTDNLGTITTAGYLNNIDFSVAPILPSDVLGITYGFNTTTNSGSFGLFNVAISNGTITLSQGSTTGVTLPTIANHIATFTNTTGTISEDPGTAISGGNIQAGLSGTAGALISFPGTAASGNLQLKAINSAGNFAAIISNASLGQASTWTLADPGGATSNILQAPAALVSGNLVQASGTAGLSADAGIAGNKVLTSSIVSPDVSIDLVAFDVTVGQAALAAGGSVTLIASSGAKQYKIRSLQLNSGGTNFSGGGGDRLGQVTDGTTVYTVIPAANMQALTNNQWGTTALPNPASAAINTSTAAGANLVFKYSGGATDYTVGSLVITGIAQRVA